MAQGLAALNTAHLTGSQRFNTLAKVNAVSSASLVIGLIAGVHFFGVIGGLAGYIAGALFPAALSLSMMLREGDGGSQPDPELRARVWKYAVTTWLAAIVSSIVWSRAEIFFIDRYWSAHEAAILRCC